MPEREPILSSRAKEPRSTPELEAYHSRLSSTIAQREGWIHSIGGEAEIEQVIAGAKEYPFSEHRRFAIGARVVRSVNRLRLSLVDIHQKEITRKERDLHQAVLEVNRGIPFTDRQKRDALAVLADLKTLPERDPILARAKAYYDSQQEEAKKKEAPQKQEEIPEEEKQRQKVLLSAIRSFKLTDFERRSLEVGVVYSEARPGSIVDWERRMYPDENILEQATGKLHPLRRRALDKVATKIQLVTMWPEGQGPGKRVAHYLELVGPSEQTRIRQAAREKTTVTIDGKEVGFVGGVTGRLFQALANTSENNQIPITIFVEEGYGEYDTRNLRKAHSLVHVLNKEDGQGAANNLEIVMSGKGEQATVYLKRLAIIERPPVPPARGTLPTFEAWEPDLTGLRYQYKELPPKPLEDYSKLAINPELVRFIRGARGLTGELFQKFLLNGQATTRICNAIVMLRDKPKNHVTIAEFETLLDAALLEEVGSIHLDQSYARGGMKLITPTQAFLLYANANPNREVIHNDQYGLFLSVEGISTADGFLVIETADAVEIRRLLEFKNVNGNHIDYPAIQQQNRYYTTDALRSALRLDADPVDTDRLTVLLHALNPDISAHPLTVSSLLRVIYGVPDKSHFEMEGVEIEPIPPSTAEIHELGLALRRALIP